MSLMDYDKLFDGKKFINDLFNEDSKPNKKTEIILLEASIRGMQGRVKKLKLEIIEEGTK